MLLNEQRVGFGNVLSQTSENTSRYGDIQLAWNVTEKYWDIEELWEHRRDLETRWIIFRLTAETLWNNCFLSSTAVYWPDAHNRQFRDMFIPTVVYSLYGLISFFVVSQAW